MKIMTFLVALVAFELELALGSECSTVNSHLVDQGILSLCHQKHVNGPYSETFHSNVHVHKLHSNPF